MDLLYHLTIGAFLSRIMYKIQFDKLPPQLISISLGFIYLIIPFFYNYGNQSIAEKICKTYNVECEVNGKISYIPTMALSEKEKTELVLKDGQEI